MLKVLILLQIGNLKSVSFSEVSFPYKYNKCFELSNPMLPYIL